MRIAAAVAVAELPPTPLLDALKEHRIVSVRLQPNGSFRIRDECHYEHMAGLNTKQLIELASELLALAAYADSIT